MCFVLCFVCNVTTSMYRVLCAIVPKLNSIRARSKEEYDSEILFTEFKISACVPS
jgi:hypothetical protein